MTPTLADYQKIYKELREVSDTNLAYILDELERYKPDDLLSNGMTVAEFNGSINWEIASRRLQSAMRWIDPKAKPVIKVQNIMFKRLFPGDGEYGFNKFLGLEWKSSKNAFGMFCENPIVFPFTGIIGTILRFIYWIKRKKNARRN